MNSAKRYGMTINVDHCTGCGACAVACAVENNVAPANPAATIRNGVTWLRLYEVRNLAPGGNGASAFFPLFCQQCGEHTPCVSVCPQQAVEVDPKTGIVGQIAERCFGCRYCMVACPYQSRYFNWFDPQWPGQSAKALNPDVSPRMRGVVEKCNFCHGRLQQAEAKAAAAGRKEIDPADYIPACVEACPSQSIAFHDLAAPPSPPGAFRLLENLGTDPKIRFTTSRDWVRQAALEGFRPGPKESAHA